MNKEYGMDKTLNNNSTQVFKDKETPSGKPLRYSHDSLTKDLIGKSVVISILGGRNESGILKECGMYDILLEMSNKRTLIILKSAILTVVVM
jgi:hypothetical protein